jgi:hypothetical protein
MRRETATRVKPVCSVAAVAMAPPWGAQFRMIASLMSSICISWIYFKVFYSIFFRINQLKPSRERLNFPKLMPKNSQIHVLIFPNLQ